ncbi:MAG TPA: hypothetical protein VMT32_09695 [Bryobacteraceae bacterium]|nr:hypothetical protein [Bryobacteraceae bacterium]
MDAAPNGFQPAATNQDSEATPFLELLGDVLPKGRLSQDQPGDAVKSASTSLSQLPGMTLGSNYEVTASQGSDVPANSEVKRETAETVAPNARAARASQPSDAAPNATQQAPGTGNALWEQAVGSDVAVEPEQKAPEAAAVAFAARISSRTPDPQMIAPNEAQAAIAASRFAGLDGDLAKTQRPAAPVRGEQTASPARMAQRVAEPQESEEQRVAVAVFEFEDPDGSSGEPQSNAEPNANPGTSLTPAQPAGTGQSGLATQTIAPDAQMAAQPQTSAGAQQTAAVRVPSTQATQGTIAPRTAVGAREGWNPALGTPNASSGFAMAAPANSSAAGARAATNAKPAQEERATPFLEPQNEPAERASEMVRAISLNLSSKDQSVQVRLSERAGELHVTVRTPDAGLTHGLREGLSDLVGRLEHGGFRAEAWRPAGSDASDHGQDSPSRRGSSQQENGKESRQQENLQDPESEAQTPKWMGELESSFQRSNSVWPPSAIR